MIISSVIFRELLTFLINIFDFSVVHKGTVVSMEKCHMCWILDDAVVDTSKFTPAELKGANILSNDVLFRITEVDFS